MSTVVVTPLSTIFIRSQAPENMDNIDNLLAEFADAIMISMESCETTEGVFAEWKVLVRNQAGGGFKWIPLIDLGKEAAATTASNVRPLRG